MVIDTSMPLLSGVSITRGVLIEHREKPAIVVERADHRDVALERVLPERPARAEGEEAGVAGEHQRAQLVARQMLVADEGDAADADLLVLAHGVAHDHGVAPLRDHLARDLRQEVALLGVHVADLLDAAAHGRLAQDGVVLDLERFE